MPAATGDTLNANDMSTGEIARKAGAAESSELIVKYCFQKVFGSRRSTSTRLRWLVPKLLSAWIGGDLPRRRVGDQRVCPGSDGMGHNAATQNSIGCVSVGMTA